jgi:DNA topoisomerase VI subunit B
MSKLKNFCKNLSRKSKAKSAKRKTAKLEKRMNKLAEKADKICRNREDFDILANKIFDKRDYRIHMSKFKAHNYKFEED